MRQLTIIALMILCIAGCSSAPFQMVSYVPVEAVQPAKVREQFARSLPSTFQLINTIVFQYKRHTTSAIGYTAVDTDRKSFTVACLNPMGIKLFELSGNGDDVECRFALEEFTRQGDITRAVADDIKRIYFDRVPTPEAEVYKKTHRIVFRQPAEKGTMKYVFAGADNVLIEKQYHEGRHRIWSVFYYEYQRENGKLYPAGIILKHHRYGYQLIVRLKEIRS